MNQKLIIALLSALVLIGLSQYTDCKTLSERSELGYKLPDELLENTSETFNRGRLYRRDADSDEEDDDEDDDDDDADLDEEEPEGVQEEDDDDETEDESVKEELPETTTKSKAQKKAAKKAEKKAKKAEKKAEKEEKKLKKKECIKNCKDLTEKKLKKSCKKECKCHHHQSDHHHQANEGTDSNGNETTLVDLHSHSEHEGLSLTEAQLEEHHHHHHEENSTGHDFGIMFETHNHHSDANLTDAEIHKKYHHKHNKSNRNPFKPRRRNHQNKSNVNIKVKLDTSNCDSKFPSSELTSSIISVIKDAIQTIKKNGVVNIYVRTSDLTKNNSSYVLNDTMLLTKESFVEDLASTEVVTTESDPETTTTALSLDENDFSIQNQPDYEELKIAVPV